MPRVLLILMVSLLLASPLAGFVTVASADDPVLSLTDVIGFGRDVDGTNPMLFRMDKDGNMLWEKPFPLDKVQTQIHRFSDDRNLAEDAFYTVTFLEENKVDGKHRILKFDANGNLVWDVPFSDSSRQIMISANPVDGGIYASVSEKGIYKIDKDGNITWGPKAYGCTQFRYISTDATTGGLYVSTCEDKKLLKIAKDGTLVWIKEFPQHDYVDRVCANPIDGGVYVALDYWNRHLYKLDANATVEWHKGCLVSCYSCPRAVSPVDGSLYFEAAWPDYLAKVAMDGTLVWKVARVFFAPTALAADIEENYVYTGGSHGILGISKFSGENGALVWNTDPGYYVYQAYPGPRYYAYTGIPSPPPPVGGTIIPTDKLGLVMPWVIGAALIVVAGVSLAVWNRKRGAERASGR